MTASSASAVDLIGGGWQLNNVGQCGSTCNLRGTMADIVVPFEYHLIAEYVADADPRPGPGCGGVTVTAPQGKVASFVRSHAAIGVQLPGS